MVASLSRYLAPAAFAMALATLTLVGSSCNRDWDRYDPRVAVSSTGGSGGDGGFGGSGAAGAGGMGGMGAGGMGGGMGGGGAAVLCGGVAAFADNFADNVIDGRWDAQKEAGATIVEKDGGITLTTDTNAGDARLVTTHKYGMLGRTVTLRVLQLPNNVGAGVSFKAYFYLSSSESDRAIIGWDGKSLIASTVSNGQDSVVAKNDSYRSGAAQYWRIRHSTKTDTLYWETSFDGNMWEKFGSAPRPPSLDLAFVHVGFALTSSGQALSAKIGGYNDKTKPEPRCTSDTFTDDFNSGIFQPHWRYSFAGACTPADGNGELVFDVMGMGTCTHESGPQLDFTGKTVSVTLLESHAGSTDTEQTEFGLLLRSNVRLSFVHTLNQWHGFRSFGGPGDYEGSFVYNPQEAYKLRLREDSGTIYWEYALLADTDWTTLRTMGTPTGVSSSVLYMKAYSEAEMGMTMPFTARFDDFNLVGR